MGASQLPSSSLSCELKIIRAKNTQRIKCNTKSGQFFVRCYLSAGDNKRVRLDTQQIPSKSKSDPFWNETFTLECSGTQDSMQKLMQGTITLELRHRPSTVLGRIGGSNLVGRAKVPWKTFSESPEQWVVMVSENGRGNDKDSKPPLLQVAVRTQVPAVPDAVPGRRTRRNRREECGCVDGSAECEMFALVAALDDL
ncbi:hypothetical protein NMG60_11007328 [Bertholletia excelsa]